MRFVQASFLIMVAISASVRLCVPHSSDHASLPTPPQLYAHNHELSVTLHAVGDANGHGEFAFNGKPVAPVLRA